MRTSRYIRSSKIGFVKRTYYFREKIVLFKSLRKYKRLNKGNFTLKSNSNKITLCGGQHYLVLKKIVT